MKKISIKAIFRGVVLVAVFVLFGVLISFLNSDMQVTEVAKWQTDALTDATGKTWESVASNESLELYFHPETTQIKVVDKATGLEWLSNPENAAADTVAFGQNKTAVQSLLNITYVDDQSNYYTVNSFQGAVQNKTYRYEYDGKGVTVTYQFGNEEFEIACYFGLEDGRFVARILNDQMIQHGKLQIASVALLPFFGAGSLEDEGYLFVPDGAGALIYFNNQKQGYQAYSQSVYGRDQVLNLQTNILAAENAIMPVFGLVKNDAAMLAIITKGEYQADINAEVSRKRTSNNVVYSTAAYIRSETNTLLSGSANEEMTTMISMQHKEFPYYEVSYFFLGSNTGYNEMAARYREYLINEKGMQQHSEGDQKTVGLTFLGGVKVRKTLLGLPYNTVEALTPYKDMQEWVLGLTQKSQGTALVSMYNMENGGSESKLPAKITYEGNLGGKKNYKRMVESLESAGIPFYPVYDPVTMKKTGNGYSSFKAARNVSKSAALQYKYLLSSGRQDTDKSPDYLISPRFVTAIMDKMLKSCNKQGVGRLGLSGITEKVYSDFNSDSISRNQAGVYWEEAIKMAAEATGGNLLAQGANAYVYPFANVITQVPVSSSQYDIEDEEIPFLQMVMSGYAALYSEPVNYSGNVQEMLLRCAEYGVSPSFLCMTARADILQDTKHKEYYSVSVESWEDTIQDTMNRFTELADCMNQSMTNHEKVADGVYATTYGNGSVVYVNYNKNEVTVDGVIIPARSFVKRGNVQ